MKLNLVPILFSLFVGFVSAVPTGAEVLNDLIVATEKLDATLENWNGGPFTMFPMGLQSQSLIKKIDSATTVFQGLGTRTDDADVDVLEAGQKGADSIEHALKTVLATRAKFEKIPLGIPIMFGVLKGLQLPTNRMTSAIVMGASSTGGPGLQKLQAHVKQLFVDAMNAFDE